MDKQLSLNDILKKKLNEIKAETSSEQGDAIQSTSVQPKNKTSLDDPDLINDIDDFDKDQWVKLRTSYANKWLPF